jgi:hypothetical protein
MNSVFSRLLLLSALFAVITSVHAAPKLAGHPAFKGQTLDADGVKAVLLGKKITIGDARVVIVIVKASGSQDAFLQARLSMSTSQFQNHWRRLFMTGGGTVPKIVDTEADALKLATETPGAVTIADSAALGSLAVLAN